MLALCLTVLSAAPDRPTADQLAAAAEYSTANGGQALVVLFAGERVLERYDGPGDVGRRQMLASGSKSLVGLAAAVAAGDGLIGLDTPVSAVLPDWKADPKRAAITSRHLLALTSGLLPGERGTATRGPAWKDILAKPVRGTPGGQYEYGPFQLNAFAAVLERKLPGGETFEAYLNRKLLAPLGADVEWRYKCADGHPQVGGGAFMTARHWAAVGELVRNRGKHGDKQLIDPDRLAECFVGTGPNPAYGLAWWLKKPVTAAHKKAVPLLAKEWGRVCDAGWLPADLVAACGAGKQRLYVVPSRKLVVARMGGLSQSFRDVEFLAELLGRPAGDR